MEEHALLNRILLIYDEAVRRLEANIDLDLYILKTTFLLFMGFIKRFSKKIP